MTIREAALVMRVARQKRTLIDLLDTDRLDEPAIQEQIDAASTTELKMQRIRFRTLIRINTVLTTEQRRRLLAEARKESTGPQRDDLEMSEPPEDVETIRARLTGKVERIKRLGERRHRRGESVRELERRMREVERLVHDGRQIEAEAILDAILKGLESEADPDAAGDSSSGLEVKSGPIDRARLGA